MYVTIFKVLKAQTS